MKFFDYFDKKRFVRVSVIIVLLLFLVVFVNTLDITNSRYESIASSAANAKVAFFIVDSGTYEESIYLSDLTPSNELYTYQFTVSNFNSSRRANVNMRYSINFKTTTNLPLTYMIVEGDYTSTSTNIISNESYILDKDGMYYKLMETDSSHTFSYLTDSTHIYTLVINFPSTYKNSPDLYQSLIDLITITINAEQVV